MFEEDTKEMEKVLVSGVVYDKNQARVTVAKVPDRPGIASKIFDPVFKAGIVVDMIIQNTSVEGLTDLTFTVAKTDFKETLGIVRGIADKIGAGEAFGEQDIAKVSIVGLGMRNHAGIASEMFNALSRENINISMISTSEIKISCVIEEKYTELAVRALHEAFGLGDEKQEDE